MKKHFKLLAPSMCMFLVCMFSQHMHAIEKETASSTIGVVHNRIDSKDYSSEKLQSPGYDGKVVTTEEGYTFKLKEEGEVLTASLIEISPYIKKAYIPKNVTINDAIKGEIYEYSVNTIVANALSNGTIEYVAIPSCVTKIEDDAFHAATALKEVEFQDGESTLWLGCNIDDSGIKEGLFSNSPIQNVYVGRNLEWAENETHNEPFSGRNQLNEIQFGPRITVVGNMANPTCTNFDLFYGCENVKKYSFLGDGASMGTVVKIYCADGLSYATEAFINRDLEESFFVEYTFGGNRKAISDRIVSVKFGQYVTYVPKMIYSGFGPYHNVHLQNVDFTEATSLKTIRERAFAHCDKLEKIDLSETEVTTIGTECFFDCQNLKDLNFGNTVQNIEMSAFESTGITQINLPSSLVTLGNRAFYDCTKATNLIIAPNDEALNCLDYRSNCSTFSSCAELKNVYLGRTLTWNEYNETSSPFYGSLIETLVIDENVGNLQDYMFSGCSKLKSVNIGTNISQIPNNCFFNAENIETFVLTDTIAPITLGSSCQKIKAKIMYMGRPVADVENIPNGKEDNKKTLETLHVGECAAIVKSNSFVDLPKLKSVTLQANITLENSAFVNCGIEDLYVQGNAFFKTNAVKNCNNIIELTVVGKLTMEESAFAPGNGAPAIRKINVFFSEDPKDESHAKSFPQKYLDESVLCNLFDSPYNQVTFTCLPWSGFKNRSSMSANDYAPSDKELDNDYYDHAYIRNTHKERKYFSAYMPFNVSTYYFGSDAIAYNFRVNDGFTDSYTDDAVTLRTVHNENLDESNNFLWNIPFIIYSNYGDSIVKARIDQFQDKQVEVIFALNAHTPALPYFVSAKDEIINPQQGNYYVIDNGCLKKVNGDYELRAFNVAFNASGKQKMHFVDSKTDSPLIPDEAIVTPEYHLMGYTTFYSSESSFEVKGAEVYTVSETTNQRGNTTLTLNLVKDGIVSQGQGVVIKYLPGETLHMQMVTNESSDAEAYGANVLKGVDEDTPVSQLGDIYVLGKVNNLVGFFPYYTAEGNKADGLLHANKAYLNSNDVSAGVLPFVIDSEVPTAIDDLNAAGNMNSRIYDLNGRHVINPEHGGIYIKDGKVIIKK
ncbi:MAG: leucine-rich repeat protein [Bacteroidales bacterium]|nr:leucine-rich repeat protein [Bacteroidales bacterium]